MRVLTGTQNTLEVLGRYSVVALWDWCFSLQGRKQMRIAWQRGRGYIQEEESLNLYTYLWFIYWFLV